MEKDIQTLVNAGKYMLANRLAWGTSGNISLRLDEKNMLITASGTFMGELSKDDFVVFNIETGTYEGLRKASKETPIHSGIYKNRPDIHAVVHSSPFHTTLMACSNEPILSDLFIETMYYLENIEYVDYLHPGSIELGQEIAKSCVTANIIIMRNHGVTVIDDSMNEAIMRLETLENACKMIITSKAAGIKLTEIPKMVVREFLEESKYKPRKKL
ncbi:class II aldolase/adducin family protein [Bacillus sp. JJ1521]|uniref:class II aldolase/adducin family protein n=1 Tax=Bacillus sp. JJ1521 TaxID=3122957 RepID=UPI002FFE12CC